VDLSALRARLVEVARPDSIIIWLYQPHAQDLLRGLAAGTIPLTHVALDDVEARAAAEHLRGLLVAVKLLPARDERLAHFDRWIAEHLGDFATGTDLKVLNQFATWGLRRHLVARSEAEPLRDAQITNATQKLRVGGSLLAWLHQRGHALGDATQADIDEWFATPPTTRVLATTFLSWAITTKHCPILEIPRRRSGSSAVLDHAARLDILARLLEPATGRLEHRVAAMLLVLFGQPFHRISAPTVEDVVVDDGNRHSPRRGHQPRPSAVRSVGPRALRQPPEPEHRHQPDQRVALFPATPPTATSRPTSCGSVPSR